MGQLLAVDLGLRTGLAVFGPDGRLRSYRSQNLGTRSRLKRAAAGTVAAHAPLAALAVEGDAALARLWVREAERRGARSLVVAPERWRVLLLHPRERRDGATAKQHAGRVARATIAWSGAPTPTALRHDAAEAICIGLYAVLALGWLEALPPALDPARR
jgi:hypothetical protein